jgi:ribonuclease P protein component
MGVSRRDESRAGIVRRMCDSAHLVSCCRAVPRFDTLLRAVLSSAPTTNAPTRSRAPGAFACLMGSKSYPRGRMERIVRQPDDEADLPAQEAAPRKGARLSRPDEDHRGAAGAGQATGARSQATHGLIGERGAHPPRLVMLSRPQDFAAIQGRGTARSHPLLFARFLRTDLETTRFGLSTGRKLGGAVVRNRVRRRLREALRVMAPSFQPGWDVLIIARPALVAADHDALVDALRRLLGRGGVLGGPSAS